LDFWWRPLLVASGLAFAALFFSATLGVSFGLGILAFGLALYLLRLLRQLHRLNTWLLTPDIPAPQGSGTWGDVLYRLDKLLRTKNERQQKAVADLEQILHATASLPEGVLIMDEDDRIVWLNDSAARHLGISRERDTGQFIHYLLRNSRFVEWLAQPGEQERLTYRTPGPATRTLALELVAMTGQRRMLISHDITDVERVDAMRRDFVANVSHELRTPITVIAGFLEAFDEMGAPDASEFSRHVRLMREQSDRIRRLLDDLLTLARLESDPDMQNEAIDASALFRRMYDDARSLSQGKHEISLNLDTEARLIGNEQEIYSAFGNLVSNAVRYTPAGGRIALRLANGLNNGIEFSVTDSGEGIAAQHIPRLTERFYRVDRGRSRATGGTGLGLAIVKHVLHRHQGRLRIESVVGKGSTFTAVLPAERVIPAGAETAQSAATAVP
jgi:two-component system phosphate regulon sensor histidine kinase PhoR